MDRFLGTTNMGRPKKTAASTGKTAGLLGLRDLVTEINPLWSVILKRLQKSSRTYGFARIETPIVEDTGLYEQYYKNTVNPAQNMAPLTLGGKPSVIRSSILPSVLRNYLDYKVYETVPISKWAYAGNVISADEHGGAVSEYQFGFEIFGAFNHLTEAQTIGAVWDFLSSLELSELVLEINTIGQADCQSGYQGVLKDFLKDRKFSLCDNCNEHLSGRTLNVFRCDNLGCQAIVSEAPSILDFLDPASHKHFTNILEALDELQIPYQLNPFYAGIEGTSSTSLVIKYKHEDKVITIGEGSYHTELLKNIGGKNLCSFGFVGNLSSVYSALELSAVEVVPGNSSEVFLVPLGELAAKKSLRLFRDLTASQVTVYDHFGTVGVKSQLKAAETSKSPIALIMGQKEALEEMVILRDVKSGMQEIFSYDKIVAEVKKRLGK